MERGTDTRFTEHTRYPVHDDTLDPCAYKIPKWRQWVEKALLLNQKE
ncbi:hypothetical protein PspLS_00134 [Pyricularia sp. CBS 133598]|nr:hypothetical protein PspLS_00134 [Pyricularia sp. CBS 133598]